MVPCHYACRPRSDPPVGYEGTPAVTNSAITSAKLCPPRIVHIWRSKGIMLRTPRHFKDFEQVMRSLCVPLWTSGNIYKDTPIPCLPHPSPSRISPLSPQGLIRTSHHFQYAFLALHFRSDCNLGWLRLCCAHGCRCRSRAPSIRRIPRRRCLHW